MIVTCPACQTRYLVDDAALGGAAGRRVRCASCGNLWRHSPEAVAIGAAPAGAVAVSDAAAPASNTAIGVPVAPPLRAERSAGLLHYPVGPAALTRPSVVTERPGAARRRSATRLGIILLAAAIVFVAIIARGKIMAILPSAAPVYAAFHLTEPPGDGLGVTSALTRSANSLIVAGDIVNKTAVPRHVPPLRLTLRDSNRGDLDSQTIAPPVDRLMPGASEHFDAVFAHPGAAATGVTVEFATD